MAATNGSCSKPYRHLGHALKVPLVQNELLRVSTLCAMDDNRTSRNEHSTRCATIMFTPGHLFAFAKPSTAGKGRLGSDSSKHGRLCAHAEQEEQHSRGEKIKKACTVVGGS